MTEMPPTVTESRREVSTDGVPVAERPVDARPVDDGVALRGRPHLRAAVPATGVVRSTTVTAIAGYRAIQTVWLLAAITESILGLRVLFHAVNANGATAVVRFIDFLSAPLLSPFRDIVNDYRLGNGGMLNISALITMAVYLIATFIVARFIRIATAPRTSIPA